MKEMVPGGVITFSAGLFLEGMETRGSVRLIYFDRDLKSGLVASFEAVFRRISLLLWFWRGTWRAYLNRWESSNVSGDL